VAIAGQFPGPISTTWTFVTILLGPVSTDVKMLEWPLLGLSPVWTMSGTKCLKSILGIDRSDFSVRRGGDTEGEKADQQALQAASPSLLAHGTSVISFVSSAPEQKRGYLRLRTIKRQQRGLLGLPTCFRPK
jgi:hypothetical protein